MTEQLITLIVDKGLLALLLAIVGYWVHRSLEKLKFENTKHLEIEKQNLLLNHKILESAREKDLERVEKQLSEFYYPIYFRLQKDNAIWRLSPQLNKENQPLPREANAIIEQEYILKNHREMVEIIETKVHLIEIDPELQTQINLYLKHMVIYDTLRRIESLQTYNPVDFQAPFPADFYITIEDRIKKLQEKHERLLNQLISLPA
ncbi:MAG: hypothetical protein OHK0053_05290 [Microscillaceae bacterium]